MGRILVVAELRTNSPEARQGIIDHLSTASKYAKEQEPGVWRYMICVPQDSSDTTTVWAIEEYADKDALDSHMETQPVKNMIAYMSSNPVLAGTPTIHQLSWLEGLEVTKPEVVQQADPYIVFAEIDFNPGKRDSTLEHWKGNVESSKNESGCFVYGFSQEEVKPDTLYSLELYESESFLHDMHIKSSAVQETIEKTKDVRKELRLNKLKLHGGYTYKSS